MLAYRHAFHAGNHADVLKHTLYLRVLAYMNQKEKAYRIVDTHAGAGGYELEGDYARKTAEADAGVGLLWTRPDAPPAVVDYLAHVRAFNADGVLRLYPGSPALANRMRRPQDEAEFFELHTTDHAILDSHLGGVPGVTVRKGDGFAGLPYRLPPPSRRAVVLMDPSYEGGADYARVIEAVFTAQEKFPEGVVIVWYPLIPNKPESLRLPEALKNAAGTAPKGWLHAQMTVQETDARGFGMVGSGLFILNPPYTLHAECEVLLPYLTGVLGRYPGASHLLEHRPV